MISPVLLLCGGVCLLCAAIGVLLLCGRGALLIPGYSSMAPEARAKINEKALCRAVGAYMLVSAALLAAALLAAGRGSGRLAMLLCLLIAAGAIALIVHIGTSARFRR